jgi:hypothetical protein
MNRFALFSFGVLCLALSALIGFHVGSRSAYGSADIIKAQKFVLVNSAGESIGGWYFDGDGIRLTMKDRSIDSPSATIGVGVNHAGVYLDSRRCSARLSGSSLELYNIGNRSDEGKFEVRVEDTGTWVSLKHANQARLELVESKGDSPPRKKVIIGNAELQWFDKSLPILERPASSLIQRPMASIVVLGDSAKVKIP